MIAEILDKIIATAAEENWTIKYIAIEPDYMKQLVREILSIVGSLVEIDSLNSIKSYKETQLRVKEICGIHVAYDRINPKQ